MAAIQKVGCCIGIWGVCALVLAGCLMFVLKPDSAVGGCLCGKLHVGLWRSNLCWGMAWEVLRLLMAMRKKLISRQGL